MKYLFFVAWLSGGFACLNYACKPKDRRNDCEIRRERQNREQDEAALSESQVGQLLAPRETDFFDEVQSMKMFSRILNHVICLPEKKLSKIALDELISSEDPGSCLHSMHRDELYQLFCENNNKLTESPLLLRKRGSICDSGDVSDEEECGISDEEEEDNVPTLPARAHMRFDRAVKHFQNSSATPSNESAEVFSQVVNHILNLPKEKFYYPNRRRMKIGQLIGILNQYDPGRKKLSPSHINLLCEKFVAN